MLGGVEWVVWGRFLESRGAWGRLEGRVGGGVAGGGFGRGVDDHVLSNGINHNIDLDHELGLDESNHV